MKTPMPQAVQSLIAAAVALLEARADQMMTAAEWRALRDAVVDCGAELDEDNADAAHPAESATA